jgi:3-oxoacyl-[acyl-carrier-protein] synthase-1
VCVCDMSLSICGMGTVTSLGRTTEETATAYEQGRRCFQETPVVGLDGQRLIASLAMPFTPAFTGLTRAMALARPALAECLGQVRDMARRRTALLLCLPFVPPEEVHAAGSELLASIASSLATTHRISVSALLPFEMGHAACFVALRRAAEFLAGDVADQCVVGGVQSIGEQAILERLDLQDQVRSARVPDGPVPGEAAAFLCLRRAEDEPGVPLVQGFSYAHERAPGSTPGPGMIGTIAGAFAMWSGDPNAVAFLAADLGGTDEHARSAALADLRIAWPGRELPALLHPADQLGDIGAASAPLLLGLAARRLMSLPRGLAGMVLCSSPNTLRGATIVTRPFMAEA